MAKLPTFGYGVGGRGQGPGYGKLGGFGEWLGGFRGHSGADYAGSAYDTFARQYVQGLGGAIQRFNPVLNLVNYSYNNPLLGKLQQFRYNLLLRREEQQQAIGPGAGAARAAYGGPGKVDPIQARSPSTNPPTAGGVGDGGPMMDVPVRNDFSERMITALKDLGDRLSDDLFKIRDELKTLNVKTNGIEQGIAGQSKTLKDVGMQLGLMVKLMQDTMAREKFAGSEANIENGLNDVQFSKKPLTDKKKDNWLNNLKNSLLNGAMMFGASVSSMFKSLVEKFRSSRAIKSVQGAFAKLSDFVKGPKFIKFARISGRLGLLITALFAVYDGVKGFLKGFNEKEGNILQKTFSGFIGAVKGILDGFIEPFKMLGQFILDLLDKIPGFKKFRENVAKKAAPVVERAKEASEVVVETAKKGVEKAKDFIDDALGGVSRMFESGSRGVGAIANTKGDPGGKSYGTYQLSLNAGTLPNYLKSSEYGKEFEGIEVGSKEFDSKWRKLAKEDGKNFEKDQHEYIRRTHYEPAAKAAQKLGLDLSDAGMREAVWSMSVQHSLPGVKKIIQTAVSHPNWKSMSREEKLRELYRARSDYAVASIMSSKKRGSDKVARSVADRYTREVGEILKIDPLAGRQQEALQQAQQQLRAKEAAVKSPTASNVQLNNAPTSVTTVNNTTSRNYPQVAYDRRGLDTSSGFF